MPPDSGMSMQYHKVKAAADIAPTVAGKLKTAADQAEPGLMALPRTFPNWSTSGAVTTVVGAHLGDIRQNADGLYVWHGHVYTSIGAVVTAENTNTRNANSIAKLLAQ
jgi:hypothetical protein